jgi:hypothetical protein
MTIWIFYDLKELNIGRFVPFYSSKFPMIYLYLDTWSRPLYNYAVQNI